jgi:hypothetical protein
MVGRPRCLITAALWLTGCRPDLPAPGVLATGEGVLVWVAAEAPGLRAQERVPGGWESLDVEAVAWAGGAYWWLSGGDPDTSYRLIEGRDAGPEASPEPLDFALTTTPEHGGALAGEALGLAIAATFPELPLEVSLDLDGTPLSPSCLADATLAECTGSDAERLSAEAGVFTWAQGLSDVATEPRLHVVGATLSLGGQALGTSDAVLLFAGRRLVWGDLHAHSGLSHDGCEEVGDDCRPRGDEPGEDFFARASDAALDFVAMTEHAEYLTYLPEDDGPEVSIWEAEQQRVQDAEGLVALLGYEWTFVRPGLVGGHKTVLLEEVSSCASRRIGAGVSEPSTDLPGGGRFMDMNPEVVLSNRALWDALDAAQGTCPGSGRAVTFAHHPAWTPPEMVDWTDPVNTPDPDFEPVVEIHSEHASSECADLSAEGCDWGLATEPTRIHYPEGAVQTALAQGYRLGFVGGTDGHDARPGSIDDGPSCTSRMTDTDDDGIEDTFICHEQGGALTGVYTAADTLSRGALLDALFARETAATSGPRLPLRIVLRDGDGAVRLPGAAAAAGDVAVYIALGEEDLDGLEFIEAALLAPDNHTIAWTDTLPAILDVSLQDNTTAYLRLRLWDPDAEAEQRIWLSPWFMD